MCYVLTIPTTMVACGNLDICAGLGAGIESTVNSTLLDYENAWRQLEDVGEGEAYRTSSLLSHQSPKCLPSARVITPDMTVQEREMGK